MLTSSAELEELKQKIKEAEQKLSKSEELLKNAIQEGTPNSMIETLYKESSRHLSALRAEKVVLVDKKHNIEETVENGKSFLFQTSNGACVTIIGKRQAVTFAHGEHSNLQVGSKLRIFSVKNTKVRFDVTVTKKETAIDFILLESRKNLCQEAPTTDFTLTGRDYVHLGLSATSQDKFSFCMSTGYIISSHIDKLGHILGSAGVNPGDAGGCCFDAHSGSLIGMNVGTERSDISLDDTGHEIADSRHAARAHIIPINKML